MEKYIKIELNKNDTFTLYATLIDVIEECIEDDTIQEEYIEKIGNIATQIENEIDKARKEERRKRNYSKNL